VDQQDGVARAAGGSAVDIGKVEPFMRKFGDQPNLPRKPEARRDLSDSLCAL
jgi:hypothetical protein